ncbi:unnamed protein product [Paramecium sonneborni]|uniref:Uncharacterized protein n=1 Tax=Paramecium sonneborni TaxID=65129 RepID=A0A8S1R776_9CILI|nr:unnamed protein product [Paramecium sonneborni]
MIEMISRDFIHSKQFYHFIWRRNRYQKSERFIFCGIETILRDQFLNKKSLLKIAFTINANRMHQQKFNQVI